MFQNEKELLNVNVFKVGYKVKSHLLPIVVVVVSVPGNSFI